LSDDFTPSSVRTWLTRSRLGCGKSMLTSPLASAGSSTVWSRTILYVSVSSVDLTAPYHCGLGTSVTDALGTKPLSGMISGPPDQCGTLLLKYFHCSSRLGPTASSAMRAG